MRLYLIAVAAAGLAGLATGLVIRADALRDVAPLTVALVVFAGALIIGWMTLATARRAMRDLLDSTREVVRDTTKRIAVDTLASPEDEVRQLGEWVNFLAEDAERSHRAHVQERVLLSSVADGLTQGVIALSADHKIELLNDAARRMLGV
ncbi:MAG TPA: hypothetical protein VGO00_24815, partial [Kofleriaceae bacterium]|nr:hypothetical protein [Kofleriaceae bacterium]